MTQPRPHRLGDLQLRIMKVLWQKPGASVADVLDGLGPDAGLAYTTIATMLRKMEGRGLVRHQSEGRRFLYEAAVPPEAVTEDMAGHLLERLFEGSLSALMSHLLESRDVSREELRRLQRLIAERMKQP